MGKTHKPRAGSMQIWPRKRAKRAYARVRNYIPSKDNKLLGFAGYKAGMTHIIATENRKTSPNKGQDIAIPVTIIECPPLRIAGVRTYAETYQGLAVKDTFMAKYDKELSRRLPLQKKEHSLEKINLSEITQLRALIETTPSNTGIGKKKPELFEMAIGGTKEQQLAFLKEKFGKEVSVQDALVEGQQVDVFAVTKGKGFQGPVKRFGVEIRQHKAEKTKRGPASLGGWFADGHIMYRVAHAGQMGYHQRAEYNKQVLKIGANPQEVNPLGGLVRYGVVKNSFILIRGSVAGPKKRLIRFEPSRRSNRKIDAQAPQIQMISTISQQ